MNIMLFLTLIELTNSDKLPGMKSNSMKRQEQ